MEIDVTHLVYERDTYAFCNSIARSGLSNIGQVTWRNALEEARSEPLLTEPDQIAEAKDYFKEFGAWDKDEIAAWTDDDVNALLVQEVSHNIQELDDFIDDDGEIDWKAYHEDAERGQVSGMLWADDENVYFTISH